MALQYIPGRAISLTSQAAGDVAYYNGTEWIRLAKGTAAQHLAINSGATAPEWVNAAGSTATGTTIFTRLPQVATTSGTIVNIATGLPAGIIVFWITLTDVSGNDNPGDRNWLIQFGDSGGFETSGYTSTGVKTNGSGQGAVFHNTQPGGFVHVNGTAAQKSNGIWMFSRMDNIGHWVGSYSSGENAFGGSHGGGNKILSGELTQVRITSETTPQTFDAGAVQMTYVIP